MKLSVEKYLRRIGVKGKITPTLENLNHLQNAHLRNVPYENCEIFFDAAMPSLEPDALYDKIVNRRRGGYCFELNGAFGWLLRSLGYDVTDYFGRWHVSESDPVPMRRHRVLRVNIEGMTYLADAGIGRPCPLTPLLFEESLIQERNGLRFKIEADSVLGFAVKYDSPDGWMNYYSFQCVAQQPCDFNYVNYYCSMNADFIFRNNLYVNLPAESGRRSIFTIHEPEADGRAHHVFRAELAGGEVIESVYHTREELLPVLKQQFGIVLS